MTAIALKHALAILPALGYMPMPVDFPYEKLMKIGRPKHEKYSEFGIRHPSMPCSKRAKIFAPYDALEGFNDLIKRKETLYEPMSLVLVNRRPGYRYLR